MSARKGIDRICVLIVAATVIIGLIFCNGSAFGIGTVARGIGYENRLFDQSKVHTFEIVIDDWDEFLATCEEEVYTNCNVVIDGELIRNVGIRGKGNTSLSSVKNMNSNRYSFKIEFDQYDNTKSYHGLDKLCLNNIIQDNTYMKDYIAYTLMNDFGVDSPLCSYAYITVNGEDWGLYLAVEAVEESFLERNYGSNFGELYKPDSLSFGGGGPGKGKDFSMGNFFNTESSDKNNSSSDSKDTEASRSDSRQKSGSRSGSSVDRKNSPNGFKPSDSSNGENGMPDFGNGEMPQFNPGNMPEDFDPSEMFGGDMPSFGDGEIPQFGGVSAPGGSKPSASSKDGSSRTDTGSEKTTQSEGGKAPSGFDPSEMFGGYMPSFGGGEMPQFGGENGKGGFGGFGMGSDDVKLKYTDDDFDSYSNIFNNAKTTVNTADKKRLIRSLKALLEQSDIENTVNVEEVIRYFVIHDFLCNGDSYTGQMIHNYYLYEEDGQLSMIPWDYNLAYGSFMGGDASSSVNSPIDNPVSGDMSDRPMVSWIFDNEEYTEMYHQYYSEFMESIDLDSLISDTAEMIDEYVQKDTTKFCTYEEFQTGVEAISTFCQLRAESVEGQLDGTIPSTTEGQKSDSSSLISTDGLNTSDMGSMGGGFGGGNSRKGFEKSKSGDESADVDQVSAATLEFSSEGGDFPSFGGNMPEGFDPSEMFGSQMPEGITPPGGQEGSEDGSEDKGSRPQMGSFPSMDGIQETDHTNAYILLGVSALILLAGVVAAAKFKR